jgi:hypothetical protein
MLQVSSASSALRGRTLVERVRSVISLLGCGRVWAHAAGPHVLLGLRGDDAFARVTPVGGLAYGLAFSAPPTESRGGRWQPMLLVDALADVVEHALVAVDALPSAD